MQNDPKISPKSIPKPICKDLQQIATRIYREIIKKELLLGANLD